MKKNLAIVTLTLTLMFFVFSCNNKQDKQANTDQIEVKDSTIFGKLGDCGMSTIGLISGDTIYDISRTDEDGNEGTIYGHVVPDARFCMTIRDDGESLLKAINLSQLDKFITGYKILNCDIILNAATKPDTVQIISLSNDSLIVIGKNGRKSFIL